MTHDFRQDAQPVGDIQHGPAAEKVGRNGRAGEPGFIYQKNPQAAVAQKASQDRARYPGADNHHIVRKTFHH